MFKKNVTYIIRKKLLGGRPEKKGNFAKMADIAFEHCTS